MTVLLVLVSFTPFAITIRKNVSRDNEPTTSYLHDNFAHPNYAHNIRSDSSQDATATTDNWLSLRRFYSFSLLIHTVSP